MNSQRFVSVWDAIEDSVEEAANMKLRSSLIMALENHIIKNEMSQSQAAKFFDVTHYCISNLMRGKINLFELDVLIGMAAAAGLHVELCVIKDA